VTTRTRTSLAIATALATAAIAVPTTAGAAGPKNGAASPTRPNDRGSAPSNSVVTAAPDAVDRYLAAHQEASPRRPNDRARTPINGTAAVAPDAVQPYLLSHPTSRDRAAGESKSSVPFVGASEPKVTHPTPVERIIAQERGRRGDPLVFGLPERASVQILQRPSGFDWTDAGIGGAATLALVLLSAGGAALWHETRRQGAPA
jgi:hypothetical protein